MFLLCINMIQSQGQTTISMNLVLQPPISSHYSVFENLANHAIITLTGGNAPANIVLHGTLTNLDADFMIMTRENYMGGSFLLGANQTKVMINEVDAVIFLGRNNVDHSNIANEQWMQILQNDQLPEGNYQLCVSALTLSSAGGMTEVGSACYNFSISFAQAPIITSPFNGQELNAQVPNTVFSWTPPLGNTAGAALLYDLYVVKVPEGQNPNDAINAAVNFKANNPFIKTNQTATQYVTQPYDLSIDTGKLYAVQVIARDLSKQVSFVNNGRSEVITFTKGKKIQPGLVISTIQVPKENNKPSNGYAVTNIDPVPHSQLKGKLYYRFKDETPSSTTTGIGSPNKMAQLSAQINGKNNPDDLLYNKDNTPLSNAKPLAGKKISLVITYLFTGTYNGKQMDSDPSITKQQMNYKPADADKVLATTVTGSDGSFSFDFVNAEKQLGLIQPDFNYHTSGEFSIDVKGKMFKVMRIRVEDKYYLSPDVNIKIDPWKGMDLGNLVSYVKSYTLKIKVKTTSATFWDMAYGQGAGVAGVETLLSRKQPISSVPENEGGPGNSKFVVSKNESGADGFVEFRHLAQHDPDNKGDYYTVTCVPSALKGDFVFKTTNQKYYPPYHKLSYHNFPFNAQRTLPPSPNSQGNGGLNIATDFGEDITWNHELTIKTYIDSVELYPEAPRIAGKVQDATNVGGKTMSGVKVVMMNNWANPNPDPSKLFSYQFTNNQGRYTFSKLPVETGEYNQHGVTSVIGPSRTLIVKPDGYNAGVLPAKQPYPPLKWGQQLLNQDFLLHADGRLNGYVEDENGNAVAAIIDADGYTKTKTQFQFLYDKKGGAANQPSGNQQVTYFQINKPQNNQPVLNMAITPTGSRQSFSMAAPSGKRKITIRPEDKAYEVTDTSITIAKDKDDLPYIRFVVKRMQKRIRFKVAEAAAGQKPGKLNLPGNSGKGIPGATVRLNIAKPIEQVSDKDGYVNFSFDNMGSSFDFTIIPPQNSDYEEGSYSIGGVKNTTATVTYGNAYLKKAATISGTVTLGADKKALENAKVYIELGGGKQLSAQTDANGKYVLKGVPATPANRTVWASKPGEVPNVISQSKEITISEKNENKLDFELITDNEIAIENIFGIDAEITKKEKQTDGTWLISGNLIHLKGNENFALKNKVQSIPFTGLKIKKSGKTKNGVPLGEPVANSFATDIADMELLLQNNFAVIQQPSSGSQLQVQSNNGKGMLTGKISVLKTSFNFTEDYISLPKNSKNVFLITDKPGSSDANLPSVGADPITKKKYGLAGTDGNKISFKLVGFDASADAANSWIQDNSINLATTIQVNGLPAMSPATLDLQLGNLIIHPDKIEPLKGNTAIKFKLEKWQFEGNNWQLTQSSSSINIASGTMKTGSLDVPLSDISIKPGKLSIGAYNINNLTMANVLPIEVKTKNPVFGYNPCVGKDQGPHYEFRLVGEEGQPGVIIKDLPGMKFGDAMQFQNFSVVSNGDQILNPGSQGDNNVFYSVMKVRPLSFESGQDYVNMTSGIDLGIPQLKETSGIIQFTKEAGKVKLMLYPLNVSISGPGGVDFTPNVQFNDHPQTLTEGKFTALGTLHDKEGIVLKGVLTKTTSDAWIKVDPENQKLSLGGNNSSLANIKGSMNANMGDGTWKNFVFSGEMQGFKGMQGDTRKTFTVTGSINASNEKIEVKNIPSGFGNIGLTYDIANSRFIGNLQLDKQMGTLAIKAAANLLVDDGGWYFLAGGNLQTPGLGEMSAGLLIGDYNHMPAEVSTTLMQFAYDKHVPPSFQNGISGFFFTGMKDLPVLNIPNYSIDLGVISASFGAQAGLDARLWMDFASTGNEYGIGAMIFAHAYLQGASMTCTKFGAEARAELGLKGKYTTSTGAFSLNGCGSFSIGGSIRQCIPTPCLSDGICCEACGGISVSKGIKMDLWLDSKGKTDLSFGIGNCSGQAVMNGNW